MAKVGALGSGESITFSLPSEKHVRSLRTALYTSSKGQFRVAAKGTKVMVTRKAKIVRRAAYGSRKMKQLREAISHAVELGLVHEVHDCTHLRTLNPEQEHGLNYESSQKSHLP